MEIAEFLLARIAEDEEQLATARRMGVPPLPTGSRIASGIGNHPTMSETRMAAECEAKRRIVDMFMWKPDEEDLWDDGRERMSPAALDGRREAMRGVLFWLTHPYVGHPDYDKNWRPGA